MMIDRRNFIYSFCVVAPGIVLLSRPAQSDALSLSDPSSPVRIQDAMNVNSIVFKIDGWDRYDAVTDNQVLIKINQSWRTAWR
jgi:hypothetical protein